MKLSDLGEFGLIETIRKSFTRPSPRVFVGIGDDAAALRITPSKVLLATTDMLVEGVHFDLRLTDLYSLGWKSAAVNISDIAAMGGIPLFSLISFGMPPTVNAAEIAEFYRGFETLARIHGCVIAGGDTSASPKGLVVSVTVLGETEKKAVVTRSGARPGDRIFVSGTLGDAAAGLEVLRASISKGRTAAGKRTAVPRRYGPGENRLIRKHLRPEPRVAEGRALSTARCVSAMIDVSDGLSSDVLRVCEESGTGAELIAGRIPLSADVLRHAERLRRSPLDYALAGGEDYELLFTIPERNMKAFRRLGMQAVEIGSITKKKGVVLALPDGNEKALPAMGYDHFRRA